MVDIDIDSKYNIVDKCTPIGNPLTAHYKKSYAFYTFTHRVPVILTNLLDSLTRDKEAIFEKYGPDCKDEVKKIVGEISRLKYELQTDKKMEMIAGDDNDQDVWNNMLNEIAPRNSYFSAPWLYAECYIYRRIRSIFEQTNILRNFDHFEYSKNREFFNSLHNVAVILRCINEFNQTKSKKEEIGEFFRKLLKLNLWGNRNDLSITLGVEISVEDNGHHSNPINDVENLNEFLVVDQTEDIWKCLSDESNKKSRLVDIINDNAAYELLCDLILADFMVEHQMADQVRFHVKAIPWFISDTTPKDFKWSLEQLVNSENSILRDAGIKWSKYVDDGKFLLIEPPNHFWTSGWEYYKMESKDPNLYNLISESQIVFFKGDLNYRKLLGDLNWDPTTDFKETLKEFRPNNLCSLRTVKADLICGLKPNQSEQLFEKDPKWMQTGQYGVIQFAPRM